MPLREVLTVNVSSPKHATYQLKDPQIELIVTLTPRSMGNRRVIPYVLGSRPKLCW
jgi:hypothetical protein